MLNTLTNLMTTGFAGLVDQPIVGAASSLFASVNWWSSATMATHFLIAVTLLWWLLDSRRQRQSRNELQSAIAAFDRLFEVTADMASDVEDHSTRMKQLQQKIADWKKNQSGKRTKGDLPEAVEQLLDSNLWLLRRLTAAETQLVDQRREIQRHASAAQRDSLTGLWNRRAFDAELQEHLIAWQEDSVPLVLLLIDIDYFKQINDGFGHPAGDRVLRTIVQVISRAVRSTDALYRHGGDELALILGGASMESGRLVAEKIRAAISRLGRFSDLGVSLSISCGLAAAQPGDDCAKLVRRADDALFVSKERGRNRVSVHNGQSCTVVSGEGISREDIVSPANRSTDSETDARQTAVAVQAPPQGTAEALDAACDALQKKLDEVTKA